MISSYVCRHGFRISNCFQIVNNDIKETLPKLEAFYASYNGISAPVDDLHNWTDRVSMSAISSEAVENKIKALQVHGCT